MDRVGNDFKPTTNIGFGVIFWTSHQIGTNPSKKVVTRLIGCVAFDLAIRWSILKLFVENHFSDSEIRTHDGAVQRELSGQNRSWDDSGTITSET